MTSDEQFPPPGPDDLAPARGRSARNQQQEPAAETQEARDERPDPPQQTAYQAQPPGYEQQPSQYQPHPPGHEQQPTYQQPGYQQPGYQQPGYQSAPPADQYQQYAQQPQFQQYAQQQPQYQYQQYPQQQPQYQLPQQPEAKKSGKAGLWVGLAALVLLIPVGVGGWLLLGRGGGESEASAGWPTDPQLQHSIAVDLRDDQSLRFYVPLTGSADDFLVGEPSGDGSTITHYVDGEVKWETEVGLESPGYFLRRDEVLLFSSSNKDYTTGELARLDPDAGNIIWSIPLSGPGGFDLIDGRLFNTEYATYEGAPATVTEYDVDTGDELNQIEGADFTPVEDGFISTDNIDLTAEFIDLDLKTVEGPVTIESAGVSFYQTVVDRYDGGWVYYANRSTFGGNTSVVFLSPSGDKEFECETTIEDPNRVFMHDDSTLVVSSYEDMEVLDVADSACNSRWLYTGENEGVSISAYGEYPNVATYPVDGDLKDYSATPEVEILDWNTGEVIATGDNAIYTDRDGRMMTFAGDSIVASMIDNGDTLWTIDASADADVRPYDGTIFVIIPDSGSTGTIDVYSD